MAISRKDIEINLLLETGGGGSGRHVLDLYYDLTQLGWAAHLILSSRRADHLFEKEVKELPEDHVTFFDIRRSPHLSDIRTIYQLRSRFAALKARCILHAHSTKAALLGCGLGDTVYGKVLTPHAYRGMDQTLAFPNGLLVRNIEAAFSRRYDRIIAVSPAELQYVESLGVPAARICYIPNGIDPEPIRQAASESRLARVRSGPPLIGFVGRLVYQKNVPLFIETLRALREKGISARALIVGDGPLRESLNQLANRYGLGDQIDWRGNVPAVEELGKFDVMVHTSHYESFPYTLLEAAASETPIIAVENSGSLAILGENLPGSIISGANAEALASAIIPLLQDTETRRDHLARLHSISQRFTRDNMVHSTIGVYEDLLSR